MLDAIERRDWHARNYMAKTPTFKALTLSIYIKCALRHSKSREKKSDDALKALKTFSFL